MPLQQAIRRGIGFKAELLLFDCPLFQNTTPTREEVVKPLHFFASPDSVALPATEKENRLEGGQLALAR